MFSNRKTSQYFEKVLNILFMKRKPNILKISKPFSNHETNAVFRKCMWKLESMRREKRNKWGNGVCYYIACALVMKWLNNICFFFIYHTVESRWWSGERFSSSSLLLCRQEEKKKQIQSGRKPRQKSFFETLGQFEAAFHRKPDVKREMTRGRYHFLLHDIQLKLAKARFDLHVYTRLITRGICCWNATENWTLSPKFPFFFSFPPSQIEKRLPEITWCRPSPLYKTS